MAVPCLASSDKCTGCTACVAACDSVAIEMRPDARGFLVPHIDKTKCKSCGVCDKACPVLKKRTAVIPQYVWIAAAKDSNLRQGSASGGAFTLLAQKILEEGGIVYGAGWNADFSVSHQRATTLRELEALRGSKYVQSDLGEIFKSVKADLNDGKRILFSGTPCQVAGVKAFLRKEYDNLLLVSLICQSITSPGTWAWYLEDLRGRVKSPITSINFRDKCDGKDGHMMSIRFEDKNKDIVVSMWENAYVQAFFRFLNTRESCFDCHFRSNTCGADLVIGDFWGADRHHQLFDDGHGNSSIMALTVKGVSCIEGLKSLRKEASSYEVLLEGNPYLEKCVERPLVEADRFKKVYRRVPFEVALRYALYGPWYRRAYALIRRKIGSGLRKLGLR